MAAEGHTLFKPDFVELEEDVSDSPLWNKDLAPVPILKRNWTTYNYAALWISMAHCIPTYMLASSLIDLGMNWWQALMTILLGNTIVLAPILLNSHPGTKYGIPFPVFARASYGTFGSNLPAIMRALVACGWFGIQAWIGGQGLFTFFWGVMPGFKMLLGGPGGGPTPTGGVSLPPQPAGTGDRADRCTADNDDRLCRDGGDHHQRGGGDLSARADERALGSGETRRALLTDVGRGDLDVHRRRGDAQRQHRREC